MRHRYIKFSLLTSSYRSRQSYLSLTVAERAIHKVLKDNSSRIDGWLKNARDGNAILLEGHTSGGGTVVIERANRQRKTAQRIQVTIIKKEHNGMIYYVQTVKLD
ncbi:MAG: RNase A-like domain-containing protein [Acetobacter syzygii]|uniref:RNase A-like domain-containing protein n=1 Tax=Acetobacter syzygii TaxID=146476 RepID=UPI0039EB91B1